MEKLDIIQNCRMLIAKGKSQEAINAIQELLPSKAVELSGRLSRAVHLYQEGKVTREQHQVSVNQVNSDLLHVLSQVEAGTYEKESLTKIEQHTKVAIPCWTCGMEEADRYQLIQVEHFGKNDGKWSLSGQIQLKYCQHDKCCNCGQILNDLERSIPINYPSLTCPTCKDQQFLRCDIKQVALAEEGDHFQFEVEFQCKQGHLFHQLKQRLADFLSLSSIQVSRNRIQLDRK